MPTFPTGPIEGKVNISSGAAINAAKHVGVDPQSHHAYAFSSGCGALS
jgi:hypothetical protein